MNLLYPTVIYTACVGRGKENNRDSKSKRGEFFHSRKKLVTLPLKTQHATRHAVDGEMSICFFEYFVSPRIPTFEYDGRIYKKPFKKCNIWLCRLTLQIKQQIKSKK